MMASQQRSKRQPWDLGEKSDKKGRELESNTQTGREGNCGKTKRFFHHPGGGDTDEKQPVQ